METPLSVRVARQPVPLRFLFVLAAAVVVMTFLHAPGGEAHTWQLVLEDKKGWNFKSSNPSFSVRTQAVNGDMMLVAKCGARNASAMKKCVDKLAKERFDALRDNLWIVSEKRRLLEMFIDLFENYASWDFKIKFPKYLFLCGEAGCPKECKRIHWTADVVDQQKREVSLRRERYTVFGPDVRCVNGYDFSANDTEPHQIVGRNSEPILIEAGHKPANPRRLSSGLEDGDLLPPPAPRILICHEMSGRMMYFTRPEDQPQVLQIATAQRDRRWTGPAWTTTPYREPEGETENVQTSSFIWKKAATEFCLSAEPTTPLSESGPSSLSETGPLSLEQGQQRMSSTSTHSEREGEEAFEDLGGGESPA